MNIASTAQGSKGAQSNERLGDLILESIRTWPDRIAFTDEAGSITYRALGARISQAIQALESLGLQRGDVVAQLSGNRIDMFCIMAAAYIGGFCSVTLHSMAGPVDHAAILDHCQARVVISEQAYGERRLWLQQRCPQVEQWYSHDQMDSAEYFWRLADGFAAQALQVRGTAEDIIRLAYTGGTTGKSKGVMLSNRAMRANAELWLTGLHWPDAVRCLCSAPLSHGAGSLIFPTLARGGTITLQRGFEVGRWLDAVQTQGINTTFIVPTMLYALLDHPATAHADLSSLQTLIYGAAPISPFRIREALAVFGNVLVQIYGQTEAPNTVLLLDQKDHGRHGNDLLTSAGRPFPGLDVHLLQNDNTPVRQGDVGEICVRGPLLMSGYHNDPEQTAATINNGWLHTGDLARQDAQGYFHIVDRQKDMIISGGFNVYPKEIEDVLAEHPDVQTSAVIGVPDDKWGEAVKAVVVRRNAAVDSQTLIDFVRARKGAIYAPKSVDFVDAIPLTGLGKPDKKALRQHYFTKAN